MNKVLNGQNVNSILVSFNKEKSIVSISISVEPYSEVNKEIRITNKDINVFLEEKNIKTIKCIKSSVVSNTSNNSLLGTWEYELIPDEESGKKRTKKEKIVNEH